eukprot:SAG31_NODE_1341_length_8708_cov_10.945174_11_plen_111_part_00
MVFMDGQQYLNPTGQVRAANVFDNLIHSGEIGPTVAVFLTPGRRLSKMVPKQLFAGELAIGATALADSGMQRGYEYDSMTDLYSRFIVDEILPIVDADNSVSACSSNFFA